MSILRNFRPSKQSYDSMALEFVKRLQAFSEQKESSRLVNPQNAILYRLIEQKKLDEVRAIANALINAPDLGHDSKNQRPEFLNTLEQKLAFTPDKDCAKLLLEIAGWNRPHWDGSTVKICNALFTRIAGNLACGQTPEILDECFQNQRNLVNDLFWFLLAHEITIRKIPVNIPSDLSLSSDMTSFEGFRSQPDFIFYDIEKNIDPGSFHLNGGAHGRINDEITEERKIHHRVVQNILIEERLKDRGPDYIRPCVEERFTYENRAFGFSRAISEEEVTPILLSEMKLASLGNDPDKILVAKSTNQEIFSLLFGIASFGGAYSEGMGTAFGRLAAWKALAGFVDVNPNTITASELEELTNECDWFIFISDNGWFCKVCWDYGIACLRKDGKSMAVLAATDTD